jgi:hypothetical protein
MANVKELVRRSKRDSSPEGRDHRELVDITIQSGALEALGMHKHGSWQGYGGIEADLDFFDEETGVRRVETRLVFPEVDADKTTAVAIGAVLIPTGETVVYATSDGRRIFEAPYMGHDLRREVTAALNADAAERRSKGLLPPHVEFKAA